MDQSKNYHWLLASSADPQKLSATINGFLKILSSLALLAGYSEAAGHIGSLMEAVPVFVLGAVALWGAAQTIFGICRKIYYAIISV